MNKLIKKIAFSCYIYDACYRNVLKEPELGAGEDLKGKGNFVLAVLLHNVRNDKDNDHAQYNIFHSNDVKYMIKVLGHVMKPGAHENVFCSAFQSIL